MKVVGSIAAALLLTTTAPTTQGEPLDSRPSGSGRLVYDGDRQRVILLDTIDQQTDSPTLRTWTWTGERWQLQDGVGPSRRMVFAATYDSIRRRTVMFGGATVPATASINETWEIDGASWTRVANETPHGRDHHTMVYDEARRRTVLFGGGTFEKGKPYQLREDTWEWDGTTWHRAASDGPGSRSLTGMAYDAVRKHVVLFGGHGARPTPDAPRPYLNDTWIWNGEAWRRVAVDGPPMRYGHAMAFDQKAGVTLIYGGSTEDAQYADMWQWDGQRWSEIKLTAPTPGPRFGASMAYDVARDRIVLFGGRRGDTSTWVWDGRSWKEVALTRIAESRLFSRANER